MRAATVHTMDAPSSLHACEGEPLYTLHHDFKELEKKRQFRIDRAHI